MPVILLARSLAMRAMTYSSTSRSTFILNLASAEFAEGGTIHTSGPLVPPAGGTKGRDGSDTPAGISPGFAAAPPPPNVVSIVLNPGGDGMPVELAEADTFSWENVISALLRDFLMYRCMATVRWVLVMPKRHCAILMVHCAGPFDVK